MLASTRQRSILLALALTGCFTDPGDSGQGDDDATGSGDTAPTGDDGGSSGDDGGSTGGGGSGTDGSDGGSGTGDSGGTGSGDPTCASTEACMPAVPSEWSGPVTVGAGETDAPDCPASYPTSEAVTGMELDPGTPQCGCECTPAVACELKIDATDDTFSPTEECESPPVTDACLYVSATGECTANGSSDIPEPAWGMQGRICAGVEPSGDCADGTCIPVSEEFGNVCIYRTGDHDCPAAFSQRQLHYQDFSDTRSCTTCGCTPDGVPSCEIQIDVCSVGSGQEELLSSTDSSCHQLNSGDGDGVTHLGETITDPVTCTPDSTGVQGSASPTSPVTVCCLP